jgi:hypothetical protein
MTEQKRPTIKDVYDLLEKFVKESTLFGAEPGIRDEFYRQYQQLGSTLLEEQLASRKEFSRLPDATPLGPKAVEKYQTLVLWVKRTLERD